MIEFLELFAPGILLLGVAYGIANYLTALIGEKVKRIEIRYPVYFGLDFGYDDKPVIVQHVGGKIFIPENESDHLGE